MDQHEAAWAAGFFDGDGHFGIRRVGGMLRLRASATQTAEAQGVEPTVLARLRAISRVGVICGPNPANGAYSWDTTTTEHSLRFVALIGPWMSPEKRTQFQSVMRYLKTLNFGRRRPIGTRSVLYVAIARRREELEMLASDAIARAASREEGQERAWAAGFFDAEGSTYLRTDRASAALKLTMKVCQSAADGRVPEVLLRFGEIVGAGRLEGPRVDRGRLPHYAWTTSAYETGVIMHEQICPWLGSVKRDQAHHALTTYAAFIKSRRKRSMAARSLRCTSRVDRD